MKNIQAFSPQKRTFSMSKHDCSHIFYFFFFIELHGVGHHQQSWAKNILIQNIQRYNTTSKVKLGIRQLFSILVGHFALLGPDPGPHS